MNKVSIVIPVYNEWDLVKRNVEALIKFERGNLMEIIIVDDNSPVNNPHVFDVDIVKTIINSKNLGYTATVNIGLKKAVSDIIVLLDSDAYPIGSFTANLMKCYEAKDVGCVGFKTVDDAGNNTGSFDRFEPNVIGLIAGQQIQNKLDKVGFLRKKKIIPFSCTVSFRKKCLEDLEYFDSNSFPVLEADHDIAMRLHRSHWRLLLSNQITFCHAGGNSYKINNKRVLLYHEGRWKLLKKHHKLKSPYIVKELIKIRIKLELLVFAFLSKRYKNRQFNEKIEGRKIILNRVDSFN